MSSRMLQRRAAKAAKRKKLLAERRKTEGVAPSSTATQVRHAAAKPIYRCLLQGQLFEIGSGMVILARGTPRDGFAVAGFLLDIYCIGVKNAFLHTSLDESDVRDVVAAVELAAPLQPVEPGYARKLLHEAVAYARSIGIQPHKDFAAGEALFGDIVADAGNVSFQFGFEGKPFYIAGPDDSAAQTRRWLEALRKTVGEDGFDVELPDDGTDAFSDGLFYDPDEGPDPEDWLESDEDERLQSVQAYHRYADDEHGLDNVEKKEVHAGMHVAVENQLAANDPPAARRALERLLAEGLDRHEAIHAIANVLLYEMIESARQQRDFLGEAYVAALDALTLERWRAQALRED